MKRKTIKEFRNNFSSLWKAKEDIEIYFTDIKTGEVKTVGVFIPNEVNKVLPSNKASSTIKNEVAPAMESQKEIKEIEKEVKSEVLPSTEESSTIKKEERKYETCKKEGCFNLAIRNGYCSIH